jgi:hypothetical protein
MGTGAGGSRVGWMGIWAGLGVSDIENLSLGGNNVSIAIAVAFVCLQKQLQFIQTKSESRRRNNESTPLILIDDDLK